MRARAQASAPRLRRPLGKEARSRNDDARAKAGGVVSTHVREARRKSSSLSGPSFARLMPKCHFDPASTRSSACCRQSDTAYADDRRYLRVTLPFLSTSAKQSTTARSAFPPPNKTQPKPEAPTPPLPAESIRSKALTPKAKASQVIHIPDLSRHTLRLSRPTRQHKPERSR